MDWNLRQNDAFRGAKGPLLLVVLDGVGIGSGDASDAVVLARTPVLDGLLKHSPSCILSAHGTSVGLPSDGDMGNSEVGHNALGCGRVYDQGALLVNNAIANGSLFHGNTWSELIARTVQNDSALHFLGLLSDGNVHSHVDHLIAMMKRAASEGSPKLFVHILTDGRDVPGDSALIYVEKLEAAIAEINQGATTHAAIASG